MEVTAKTNTGFLIEATEEEIKEIVNAVTGSKPNSILIGQRLPAIDYASTITKLKVLKNHSTYKYLLNEAEAFNNLLRQLNEAIEKASAIEI